MTTQLKSCLSCPNSIVLVLAAKAVDVGTYPACFAILLWRVRRMDAMYKLILSNHINGGDCPALGTFEDYLITGIRWRIVLNRHYLYFLFLELIT